MLNQKLTDKPQFTGTLPNDALLHVVLPNDLTQGADGSDYKIPVDDLLPQAGQDNIDIRKSLVINADDTYEDIAATINALPPYTVTETQSLWYVCREAFTRRTILFKLMLKGKGTYGVGNIQITTSNLELIRDNVSDILDIENDPETDTILYGSIAGQTISEWLNEQTEAVVIQPQNEGYTIFKGSIDGEQTTYLWIGEAGVYGDGESQSTMADFELLADIPVTDDTNYVKKNPAPDTSQTIQQTVVISKAGGIGAQKALSIVDSNTDTETAYIDPNGDIRTTSEIIGASIISEGKVFALTPNESGIAQDDELIRRDFLESYVSSQVNPEIYTIQNATVGNVRNDSPSAITLSNGNLLCSFSHFGASGSDISTAYIAGKVSTDKGKTWGSDFPLQTNISGAINTLGASLYLNEEGNIVMVYLVSFEPNPTYKLYKTVFDQDFNVVSAAADLGISGDVASGTDRFYKDPSNGKLLLPIYRLVSGDGTSYGSIYAGSILVSEDDGETFTDLGLSIGATKLLNGYGGATETGVYYTPQGLIAYFRTLLGATYGVKLDGDYNPVGEEFELYPSANAQSSIKWIPSLNMAVAARTRLINNDPIGDNQRKYLDLLASPSGVNFSTIDQIDYAIDDVDWYVNMPIVFDIEDTVQVGYNNSKTGIKTASLFNKIYPKSFIRYEYKPEAYVGLSDDGKGKLTNGIQELNSTDGSRNFVTVRNPKNAFYSSLESSVAGAFKITLPNNRVSFLIIRGSIYEDQSNRSTQFEIHCNASDMAINTVFCNGNELAKNLNFRFVDGIKPQILIGDLSRNWIYPQVVINEVSAGYNSYLNELSEGWEINLESSSYGTVVSTKNNINTAFITGGTMSIVDAPGGSSIMMSRGTGGSMWVNLLNSDELRLYNKAGVDLFQTWFQGGNVAIGSSTNNGYKLEVSGTGKYSGTVKGAEAINNDEFVTKGQVQNLTGWAQYSGTNYTIGSPLVINSGNTSVLANNGAGTTITTQLPTGVTAFVNTANGKITPQNDGDFYVIDIRFKATSSSVDGVIDIGIDIGGAMGIIRQHTISLRKGIGVEQRVALSFPVFSGSTFVANGGEVKVTSIVGNTSIYDVTFVVDRTHKAK